MLEYMRFFLILMFVAGLGSCEEYPCISYVYKNERVVIECREGCIGVAPNCEPHCDSQCPMHSKCTKPNICECDSGYRISNETKLQSCEPICNQGCFNNAYCTSPNVCECHKGYTAVSNKDGALESCLEIRKNNVTAIHIVFYSLLICSLILVTIAGISLVIVRFKENHLKRSHDIKENSSWRTSFASYKAYDVK